jgi:hypothetical protein
MKPNILADRLDARRNLLISCPGMIAETEDGQKYKATTAPGVIAIMDKKKAAWLA